MFDEYFRSTKADLISPWLCTTASYSIVENNNSIEANFEGLDYELSLYLALDHPQIDIDISGPKTTDIIFQFNGALSLEDDFKKSSYVWLRVPSVKCLNKVGYSFAYSPEETIVEFRLLPQIGGQQRKPETARFSSLRRSKREAEFKFEFEDEDEKKILMFGAKIDTSKPYSGMLKIMFDSQELNDPLTMNVWYKSGPMYKGFELKSEMSIKSGEMVLGSIKFDVDMITKNEVRIELYSPIAFTHSENPRIEMILRQI